jgi:hypothetical protein
MLTIKSTLIEIKGYSVEKRAPLPWPGVNIDPDENELLIRNRSHNYAGSTNTLMT